MKFLIYFVLPILLFCFSFSLNADNNRNNRRIKEHLKEFGVKNAKELEEQAMHYCKEGTYNLAINRYITLQTWFPKYKLPEDTLLLIAGLQFKANKPKSSLNTIEEFGTKFPDSPKITQLVSLAYEIGKNFTLQENEHYKSVSSSLYAIQAFDFVIQHDPFSPEASNGLLSIAIINMKSKLWNDAIIRLKEIQHKQPETEFSAKADVYLGECYLRLNKGSSYSKEYLTSALRYLESYEKQNPKGKDIKYVKLLLQEAYLRNGLSLIKNIRYYCTCKKWKAASFYIEKILADPKLSAVTKEAKALKEYVAKRL
jgi:outer membrane protein assembly factor BamD (BamD/ComL family)